MVAYGVLEMKPKEIPQWPDFEELERMHEKSKAEDRERDQLRKLVNDELRRYGMLMQRAVMPYKGSWKTRSNAHILYGQPVGPSGFITREVLMEGTFQECCIMAAGILDGLDRAQVPDTAAG